MSTINRVSKTAIYQASALLATKSQRGSICSDRAVGCNRCRIDPVQRQSCRGLRRLGRRRRWLLISSDWRLLSKTYSLNGESGLFGSPLALSLSLKVSVYYVSPKP